MTNVVTLGGRVFWRIEESTVEHDFWMMAQLQEAHLDKLDLDPGVSAEEAVDAMLEQVVRSGKTLLLLAGLLIPAGMAATDWTPQVALDTHEHLRRLTDLRDKEQIKPLVASMLAVFFAAGLASVRISRSSSSEAPGDVQHDQPEQTVGA